MNQEGGEKERTNEKKKKREMNHGKPPLGKPSSILSLPFAP